MLKKILVPMDGSVHAGKALDLASDMTLKYEATIYLIYVKPPLSRISEQDVRQRINESNQETAGKIIKEAEEEVKKRGIKNYQLAILEGHPAQEIVEFAKKNGVDMIILGSHGASDLEGLLLGSVSYKVCNIAHCTCITVK